MALIDHAWTTLNLTQRTDVTLIGSDAVAVRLESVCRFRQRVTDGCIHLSVASITELSLQSVIIGDAEIHDHVHLTNSAVDRQDWSRIVSRGDGSTLALRGARKRRWSVQIDGAIEIAPM